MASKVIPIVHDGVGGALSSEEPPSLALKRGLSMKEHAGAAGTLSSEEPPSLALKRGLSMKEHAGAAGTFYMRHKYKFIALKIVIGVAIALGIVFGAIHYLNSKKVLGPSLAARRAASEGVTIKPVTIVPAKGKSASRRRLDGTGSFLRRLLEDGAVDPSNFPPTCDYNVAGSPNYVVGDSSAESVKIINMISCYVDQLRIADIGLNSTQNPNLLPYVALVNEKLCGAEDPKTSTWYVSSKGPAVYGSDGAYVTNAVIEGSAGKADSIYVEISNTVSAGVLATSKICFQMGDGNFMKGTLQMDLSSADKTDALFVMAQWMGVSINQYLHATFNPVTFVGSAVSNSVDPYYDMSTSSMNVRTTAYSLDFSANAINRRQKIDSATPTDTCIDFSLAARMLVGNRYTLYSAADGSALNFQSGFPVSHKFADYPEPATAYVSFWGIYVDSSAKPDGTYEDTTSKWVDGLQVQKMNYDESRSATDLTLKMVNARLVKVSRKQSTLDSLKGLEMIVDIWGAASTTFVIAWDGTSLKKVSENKKGCWDNTAQDFLPIAQGVTISSQLDCQCLNGLGTVSTTGSIQNNAVYMMDKGTAAIANPVVFTPTVAQFPQGINVRSKDYTFNGKILLEYDAIQTLWGVNSGNYVAGQPVTQASTGAVGTVYKSTSNKFFGLAAATVSYTQTSWTPSDCSNQGTSGSDTYVLPGAMIWQQQLQFKSTISLSTPTTMGGEALTSWATVTGLTPTNPEFSAIKVGMMVTGTGIPDYTYVLSISSAVITLSQAATSASVSNANTYSFSAVALVQDYYSYYAGYPQGLAFEYFTEGNAATFITAGGASAPIINLMLPPPDRRTGYPWSSYKTYSGTIAWGSDGISLMGITVTKGSFTGCAGGTLSLSVAGMTTQPVVTLNTWSLTLYSAYLDWTNPVTGDGCVDGAVTTVNCSTTGDTVFEADRPTVTVECARRIAAISESVKVKLSSPAATKFATSWGYSGSVSEDHTIKYTAVGGSPTNIGSPFWSNAESGEARAVSGSSVLVYQTSSVVMPGEVVPELLCSSGAGQCPEGSLAKFPSFKATTILGSKNIVITTPSSTGTPADSSGGTFTNWDKMNIQGPGVVPDNEGTYNYITSCSSATACELNVAATASATGVTILGSTHISSASDLSYGKPSHLSPQVNLNTAGSCTMIAGSGPPSATALTATYAGIGGAPVISLDWDEGTSEYTSGVETKKIYTVTFMRLTDRGKVCSSSSTPTVTWAVNSSPAATVTCDSLPTATLSCDDQSGNDMVDFREAYHYTFDSASGVMVDSTVTTGGAVVLTANNFGLSSSSSNSNQVQLGPFFENTAANKAALACDYDPAVACAWQVYDSLDTYYNYVTGTTSYASRISMVDANNKPIQFDQPHALAYEHVGTTSNSKKSYDGVSMLLQYNGPGELQGFPQVCLDADMEVADCVDRGASQTTNFPDITLPENAVIHDLVTGGKYYARAAEITERYPKAASDSICAALTFADLPTVPDLNALFVQPTNANSDLPTSADLAAKYLNAGKPEAIGGVTLYDLAALAK